MITLASPVSKARSVVGFTVLSYTDVPPRNGSDGYIGASVRLHYADGSYEDTSYTLWSGADIPAVAREVAVLDAEGNPTGETTTEIVTPAVSRAPNRYDDAGQWTDEIAQARIAALIAAA